MGLFDSIKKFVDNIFGAIGDVLGYVLGIDTDLEDKYKGQLINKSSNIQKIPVIYGERLVGGTRVFVSTGGGKKNQYLYIALVLSEGEVDSIGDIYINDIISTDSRFTNKATIYKYRGTDNQAATTLFADADESWTSAHQLKGVAYLAMRFKYDQDVFTSIPEIRAVVKGKMVYNPATQTTEWSDNPALCLRDYLTNSRYGKGLPASAIDDASIIQAASDCDSLVTPYGGATDIPLFKFNAIIDTGETVFDNVKKIIASMRGILPYSNGKYSLLVDKDQSSTFTLNEDNILSDIKIVSSSKENKFNQVTAKFPNPAKRWELDTVTYPDSGSTEETAFLNEDNQQILSKEITLHNVTNAYRAKDLARIACLASRRQSLTVSVTCTSEALNIAVGDIVTIEHDSLGWTGAAVQEFRVMGMVLDDSGEVDLTLQQYDASIYPWVEQSEIPDNPETTLPDPFTTAPVTNQSGTGQAVVQNDGTVTYFYDLEWDEPDDALVEYYLIDVNKTIDEVETLAAETLQTQNLSFRYMVSDTSIDYGFTIRAVNGAGTRSAGVTIPASSVIKDTTPPSVIDAQTTSVVAGLQSITVSWENPTEEDFDLVRIKVNDTNTLPPSHFAATRSDTFIHDIGEYSTIKYYWIAPVDTSGNVADYTFAGSATTGSIDYGDVLNPPTIPEVATTVYLTLGDNNAPTDTEFSTAVGRDPIENDSAIINKEYAFTYNGTAWTAVTEFIDGSLLVTDSVTASEINVTNLSSLSSDLGAVTAGSIDINSGVFTVNSSGDMTASSAVIDGNVTAQSLDVENATVTGTFIAPIGWSDGVYSGVINRGNLNESVKDLIDERIAEVTGGISGDFGQDDGSFSYIAQGNPDPDNPIVLNITHENGKDLTVELSGSRSWNRQFIGLPDTDMGVTIILERSPAGADTWTTLTTLTDSDSSITTSGPTLIHSSTYAYSISIYHVLTDDQASGNYDYRARTTVAGSAYSVGVPIQLTVVEPATVGAGNADTLDNQDGSYYLDYNNFTNTPTISTNYISAYYEYPSVIGTGTTPLELVNGMGGNGGVRVDFMNTTTFGNYSHVLTFSGYNGYNMYQLAGRYQGTSGANGLYFRNESGHQRNSWTAWNKLWDEDDFSSTNVSNWNTAYGWGDHSSAGYLTTHQDISGKADLSGATFTGIITVEQGENDGLRVADNKIRSVGDGLVINSDGIRFGDTSAGWDYDEWAGLKYYHPSKTIYFGGARASTSYWENNDGNTNDTEIDFVGVTNLKHNGTTFLDSNRTFIGNDGYFSGDVHVNSGSSGSDYLRLHKTASGDGGILFLTDNTLNWQNVQSSTGLNWYSYSDGSTVASIKNDGTFTAKRGYQINGTTVIDSSRNVYPNYIDMGSGHAQGYKFHGRSFSWNSAMQSPTTKMPHIWQEDYGGWDPVLGIKTTNGFWQLGAYSSDVIHFGYMAGAYGTHGTNAFDKQIQFKKEGTINTDGGYQVGGTTVIDSSRNINGAGRLRVSGGNNTDGNSQTSTGAVIGTYIDQYAFIDLASSHANGSWIDFSYADGGDYKGRIRYKNSSGIFEFHANGSSSANMSLGTSYMEMYGGIRADEYRINSTTVIDSSRNLTNITNLSGSVLSSGSVMHTYRGGKNIDDQGTYILSKDDGGWTGGSRMPSAHNGYGVISMHLHTGSYYGQIHLSANTHDMGVRFQNNTGWSHIYKVCKEDSSGNLTVSGNVTAYSDITLKDNITNIDNALEKVNSIRGVTYDRIDKDNVRQSGVIAQEVEAVLPEVVHTDDDGIKSVAYGNMVGLLIEAIKELKQEIEVLKNGTNSN